MTGRPPVDAKGPAASQLRNRPYDSGRFLINCEQRMLLVRVAVLPVSNRSGSVIRFCQAHLTPPH